MDGSGLLIQYLLLEIYLFEKNQSLFEALVPNHFLPRNLQDSTDQFAWFKGVLL